MLEPQPIQAHSFFCPPLNLLPAWLLNPQNPPSSPPFLPDAPTGDDLEKLPAHLAETRTAAQAARAVGGVGKPPALKAYGNTMRPGALQVPG